MDMYTDRPPVIGVIPHFNDADSLPDVITQLGEQNYDAIYVIDDASPQKDAFEDAVAPFAGDGVQIIRNEQNLGSAGNRNRILSQERVMTCGNALIHFVDADVTVLSEDNPDKVRDILDDETIGMAGGLLVGTDGQQSVFNYGPAFTVASHASGILQMKVDAFVKEGKINEARALRERFGVLLDACPDVTTEPEAKDVFWVVESNLMVPADVLKSAGGFPSTRYHEVQGLSLDMEEAGLRRRFDPSVAIMHPDSLNPMRRPLDQITSTLRLIGSYGVGRFIAGQYNTKILDSGSEN